MSGDTLLFSDKVKVTLNHLNRSSREVGIKRLTLKNADIHLVATDTTGVNLNFIINEIRNPDKPESEKWDLRFSNIQLDDSRFRFTHPYNEEKGSPIDYTEMDLRDLKLRVSDLTKSGDTVSFDIKKVEFTERSGFHVTNINSKMSLGKQHMHFNNTYVETPVSSVSANSLYFNFDSYRDFSEFVKKVDLEYNFRSSSVNFSDLNYFFPGIENFDETFRISGIIRGKINDLSAHKILIAYNDKTLIGGSLNIIGLPDLAETFMHFNIDMLQTNIQDLQEIHLPDNKRLSIPDEFNALGTITFSGKFTGYYDDFVTYGRFGTDLGKVSTDILIKPDSLGGLYYSGNVKTTSFGAGKIIPGNDGILGNISINAEIDGSYHKQEVSADLRGKISDLELYGYNYKNINLEGLLTKETFDGSLDISDPNILMKFEGKVDFSSQQPEFNFIADVDRFRPYYLNLNKTDSTYFASFLLESNFSGIHPDSINGEINLVNSFFQRSGEQIQISDFNVRAENAHDSSILRIRSEIMDADISGNFQYSEIPRSFHNLTTHYLPSIIAEDSLVNDVEFTDDNHFDYSIRLKNFENVSRFFTRNYFVANQSYISGNYHPDELDLNLTAEIPALGYKDKSLEELYFIAESDSGYIEYTGIASKFSITNDLGVENFQFSGQVFKDTLTTEIVWNNLEQPLYKGNIHMMAGLGTNSRTANRKIGVNMLPSYIVFNDTLWNIAQSDIYVDSSAVEIDSFIISNQHQALILSGDISQQKNSRLAINLTELDLATLNLFTKDKKIKFAGALSGQASLINAYQKPVFLSDLIVSNFHINDQDFGEGNLRALYNNDSRAVHMLASGIKGDSRIFEIDGDYYPDNKKIDFDIDFEKIRLSTFEPFAKKLVTDIKGLGNGDLSLKGTVQNPQLSGKVDFFKASMIVNYLQTQYSFTDELIVNNNNIIFDDFEISDETGNKAIAEGTIRNKYFRDFLIDLNLSTPEFMFLNTSQADNELFYGRVLASGIIEITGPPDNLNMNINASTERNSVFNIPLYGAEEINENNFVRFVNSYGEEIKEIKEEFKYEVKLKGLTMDFNLEITPEAEVQIIFDPSVGDILRGRGSGNLNMSINTLGKFEMYGDMSIEEGDYLFTLQNLINKKLEVEPGGTITWNGDPSDAIIDLKAVYKLRTSVSTLSPGYEDSRLNRRIPVECQIIMTGKLMKPNIKTDIVLPTTDQQTRNIVYNSINTDEEKLKQFISLLVMNNFMSVDPGDAFLSNSGSGTTANMAGVATSELLSSQLSHLLSQISRDFDIGLNYRPGDQITTDELEVALSTQILDDRITINGNLDVGGNEVTQTSAATNTNNIVGDFDIDFKITENGKLHLKAFNRANDNLIWQARSPYTQGVGVFYREDFNTFGELMRRYRDAILSLFTREEKEKEESEETSMVRGEQFPWR